MTDYVKELLAINPSFDAEVLEKAFARASQLHEGQFRKSGEPYIIHPMAVGKILAELGMDDHTIAAGLLHDVVEDTSYTINDVREEFGEDVAIMVDGVTKLTNLVYTTKEEAQAENVRKMFLAMSKDIRILIIKVCDRLHNMRTIDYQTPEKIREKSRETLEVYAPIAARLGMYRIKIELEDIALWTPDEPNRYYAVTTVKTPYGEDRFTTRFGFQGERPALQGVLLPHDLGPLGAVWEDGLWAERLSRLKETGCNAVSTGALPPAPGLLDLCDRMGLLFVDGSAGRRAVTDGTHPCVVDGSGQAAFDLYGYAPVGSFSTENALFNTAGFPTASYAVCRARWNTVTPVAEVIAHTPSSDGKTVLVEVRTNGDSGVLYVNGRSQGFRKVDPQRGCLSWNAAYEPGEISVLVYRNGRPWARGKAATVGAPAAVVWAEGIEQRMAGTDMTRAVVLRIPVEVVDADGKRVPDAAPTLEFSLAGFGRILAVDAGDPLSETPFTAQKIQAHQGRAAVYIYKKGEEKVILSVRSPGLKCPRMEL